MATEVKRIFDIPRRQLNDHPTNVSLAAISEGNWITYSTQQFMDEALAVSKGLIALGINPGDKVAVISNNRPNIGLFETG